MRANPRRASALAPLERRPRHGAARRRGALVSVARESCSSPSGLGAAHRSADGNAKARRYVDKVGIDFSNRVDFPVRGFGGCVAPALPSVH